MDQHPFEQMLNGAYRREYARTLLQRHRAFLKALVLRRRNELCHGQAILESLDPRHPALDGWEESVSGSPVTVAAIAAWLAYAVAPEMVLPLGYDQVRYGKPGFADPSLPADLIGLEDEVRDTPWAFFADAARALGIPLPDPSAVCDRCMKIILEASAFDMTQYRTPDGIWHGYPHVFARLIPEGKRSAREHLASLSAHWPAALQTAATSHALISLPDLWVPSKPYVETSAHTAACALVRELLSTRRALRELHWRELEEVVAELLHGMGFEITLTPRSSDGGRDVVARGEFIPGEPSLLAVEVKQMELVGVGELREALWANRHFPALLIATAGRFSAGLIREARGEDSRLRLILKDGMALQQWIDSYARERSLVQWPGTRLARP
jgi:hypothetical protein